MPTYDVVWYEKHEAKGVEAKDSESARDRAVENGSAKTFIEVDERTVEIVKVAELPHAKEFIDEDIFRDR